MDRTKNFIFVFLLVVIGVIVYANSFRNEFVWDCQTLVLNWHEIRSLKNIPCLLKGNVPMEHRGVYRPLRGVFYALNYKLWGRDHFGYHFNALLIHLCSTILVYFIILSIGKSQSLALMSAILFDVHPVHTESITYVTAAFDVTGIVFFLLSFYLYLAAFGFTNYGAKHGMKFKLFYLTSLFSASLGFFTYEMTLTLPIIIILHDFCFKAHPRQFSRSPKPVSWQVPWGEIKRMWERSKFYLPYVFLALVYAFIRVFLLGVRGRGNYIEDSFYLTMLIMIKALMKYVGLSILPLGLNVNHLIPGGILSLIHAENCHGEVAAQSIFEVHVILSIAVTILLLLIAVRKRRNLPIISFCILWFFITLLPISNVVPFQSIMSEKYLYLPSVGSCFLSAYLILMLWKVRMRYTRIITAVIFISITLFYGVSTVTRNRDWVDEVSLWRATLREVPQSSMAHMNLGAAYALLNKLDKASSHSRKSIELKPDNAKAYNNLAIIHYKLGKLQPAILYCLKVLELQPRHYKTYNNLGVIYGALGEHEKEIQCYKKTIKLNPSFIMARYNLGIVYYAKGLYELAGIQWEKILEIDSECAAAKEALAELENMGYDYTDKQ